MIERRYSFGSVSPASEQDIPILARDIRASDALELKKLANAEPEPALRTSLGNAKSAWCIRDRDGTPVTIIGLGRHPDPRCATAWMLSTDAIDKFGLLFLQETRSLVDAFMEGHDVIGNLVYSQNTKTIKWLKWLGFEVIAETPTIFSDGELFYEMARFKDDAARASYVSMIELAKRRRAAQAEATPTG